MSDDESSPHDDTSVDNPWLLAYEGYDPDDEGRREALCTLGNGYMAARGAAPEATADGVHYPGTYLAGVFNRRDTEIDDVTVTNESMVNQPNWLLLELVGPDGEQLSLDSSTVEDHRLELDLRRGILTRTLVWVHGGRRTRITQRRFVHMRQPHLAGLETTIAPEDWSGELTVRSSGSLAAYCRPSGAVPVTLRCMRRTIRETRSASGTAPKVTATTHALVRCRRPKGSSA